MRRVVHTLVWLFFFCDREMKLQNFRDVTFGVG
jgi:hypothetical protein